MMEAMQSSVRRVLVVGGSPEPAASETLRRAARGCDAVVAVDRGFDAVLAADLSCDLFCGDADSVSAAGRRLVERAEFEVQRYNPHKDYTDLDLALKAIRERWGLVDIVATCLNGGSPDHFFAAYGRLLSWAGPVEIVEDRCTGRVVRAGESWNVGEFRGSRFSFVPFSADTQVSIHHMRWELDHRDCDLLSDLGISNELDYPDGRIECHRGVIAAWVLFCSF